MRIALLALFAGFAAGDAAPAACISVSGDRIRAADLAPTIPGFFAVDPEQIIGYAPAPGVQRVFTARELGMVCRRFGVGFDPPAGRDLCFERAAKPLGKEQIAAAISATLARGDATIEVLDFSRAALPEGALVFPLSGAVRPTLAQLEAPTLWRGVVRTASGQTFAVWAKVRVTVESAGVMAGRRLRKGEAVQAGDVVLTPVRYSPLFDPSLKSVDAVVGKLLKQDVEAGGIVLRAFLEDPKEVPAGLYAHVEVESGQALISFEAKAQTGGRTGDTVLLRNPANGRSFRAIVTGKGQVRALSGSQH
jgi:flagella basal body P-ring formation protein FlgA